MTLNIAKNAMKDGLKNKTEICLLVAIRMNGIPNSVVIVHINLRNCDG